jgi:1-acyl-sn-glycerol-3-phosphate acyltransferase
MRVNFGDVAPAFSRSNEPAFRMSLPAPRSLTLHDLASFAVPGILKIRVQGHEALPRSGPVLLLVNHCSLLDPWLLSLGAGRTVQIAARSPLFWLPGLGELANRVGVVPLLPEASAGDRLHAKSFAEALEKGQPVALFGDYQLEPRPEGPRYTVSPAFLDVLLATRSENIPVVPLLSLGGGRRVQLQRNPLVAPFLRVGARVFDTTYPPVLFTENTLRVGRPVFWRAGGRPTTLQAFRREIEDSLGSLY